MTSEVKELDDQIRILIGGLISRGILDCTNLLIVSDHGFAGSPIGKNLVDLSKYEPNLNETARIFYGPVPMIRPAQNNSRGKHNHTQLIHNQMVFIER